MAALATTAGPPPAPAKAPAKAAPAGMTLEQLIGAPIDTAGITKVAHAQALADTGAVIGQLRANQAAINAQAAQRAQEATQASQGAAKFLAGLGLGPALQKGLVSAAGDQASLASGFSGQLKQTVGNQGAQVESAMKALGAPGGVPSTAASAGNAVYGVGGALPASALLAAAPMALALANQGPASLLTQGREQAIGTIGAGQKQAAAIDSQIGVEASKTPAIESKYTSQLTTAALKGKQDTIGNVLKLASQQALSDYRSATIAARAGDANAKVAAANAKASLPDPSLSRAVGVLVNAHGVPIAGGDGHPIVLPGFKIGPNGSVVKVSTTKSGTGGSSLTANSVASLVEKWHKGQPTTITELEPNKDANGNPVYKTKHTTSGQVGYLQGYKYLRSTGMDDSAARTALNTVYQRGDHGRAWLTNEEQATLKKAGRQSSVGYYQQQAWIGPNQVAALQKAGMLPPGELVNGRYFIHPGG